MFPLSSARSNSANVRLKIFAAAATASRFVAKTTRAVFARERVSHSFTFERRGKCARDHLRQMTRAGEQLVVFVGVETLDARARRAPESFNFRDSVLRAPR